jgi:hypothetical protein
VTHKELANINKEIRKINDGIAELILRFDVVCYVIVFLVAAMSAGENLVKILEYFNIKP